MKETEKSQSGKPAAADATQNGHRNSPARIETLLDHVNGRVRDGRMLLHLALISVILFVVPICFLDLCGGDETRVAGIAAEMAIENDWLTPRLNGAPFLEYPPLFYAAAAASFRIFGITVFAAKLPTALSALAGVLLLYVMMRILRRSKCESFAGAFMLATGLHYLTNAFDCRVDTMLTTFCILIWTGFALMEFSSGGAARRAAGMMLVAAGIAGGVLTKNLTGLAITLPGIACTIFFCDLAERRFSFAAYCRLAGAVLLGMLPYALYLWLLYKKNGIGAVETVFWYNNFGRFSGDVTDHSAPWWGYLVRIHEYFPPYLPLLIWGIVLQIREIRKRRSRYGIMLLTVLVIPFVVLSAASNKRQVYLLPLSAPAAMLAASTLPRIICFCRKIFGRKGRLLLRRRAGLVIYAAAVLFAAITGAIIRNYSMRKSFAPVFAEAEARRREIPGGRLVLVRPAERHSGAAYYYTHAVVPHLHSWDELQPGDVAVVPAAQLKQLPKEYSTRRFKDAKLVVVRRGK